MPIESTENQGGETEVADECAECNG
jgi:hypothetical protein